MSNNNKYILYLNYKFRNNQQRTEINHSAAKGINIIRKYFKASKRGNSFSLSIIDKN